MPGDPDFELLFELSSELMATVGPDGKLRRLNGAWQRVLGYPREELQDALLIDLVHPDDVERAREGIASLDPGCGTAEFEIRCRAKDGSYRSFLWTSTVCDGTLFLVVRDLTESKVGEAHRERLRAQLMRVYELVIAANRDIVRARTADELFGRLCQVAVETAGFSLAWLGLIDEASGMVVPVASSGAESYLEGLRVAVAADDELALGPTGTAVRECRPVVCNDIASDPLVKSWRDRCLAHGFAASGAFPLLDDGVAVGVLTVYSMIAGFFTEEESALLQQLTSDLAFAVRAKSQESELRSTEHFLHVLTGSMAEGMLAVDAEDRVTYMNRAAEELLGWDEAELRGLRMHEAIHFQHEDGSSYPLDGCPLCQVRDVEGAIVIEDDVFTRKTGELLPVAYSASPLLDGDAHGVVVVFADIASRRTEERRRRRESMELNWVGRIRDALDEDRLVVDAQPILDLASREIVSHELLVRMIDPRGTVIAPGEFLPSAERFGLIGEIDLWVASRAAEFAAAGHGVNFNLSGDTLGKPALVAQLIKATGGSGADPARLTCEITETALAGEPAVAEGSVHQLARSGCAIALDDFGSGYGGFRYLKRLPLQYLKIDREFVLNLAESPQNQHIVKAIVNLAQGFQKKTIAEGIENDETLELLNSYGVDYAQGYGIGRPVRAKHVFTRRKIST